jgi:SAM-dependent methyltransferase
MLGVESDLRLEQVLHEDGEHIVEGVLHCSSASCQREFPVVDGIPLIVADLRRYVSDNILALSARRDLSDVMESLLGDCCGPGSTLDVTRQHLSSYAWDHYADLDPAETPSGSRPGSVVRVLAAGLELPGTLPAGPILDAGCSVGRATFSLAERTGDLVLGIDLNFPMLRLAGEVLRTGVVRYPRRRVGVVYDRREFPARFAGADRVDFWACDAGALPFRSRTFSAAACQNLLDCLPAPAHFLDELGRVLQDGGRALLACPYDWAPSATPLEAWLGGHSQRSRWSGSSQAILRTLLTPGAEACSNKRLRIIAETDRLDWHVRLHERSTMNYQVHLVAVETVDVE